MAEHARIPARESDLRSIATVIDPRRWVVGAFNLAGRLRQGRVFHPDGVLLDGELRSARSPFTPGDHAVIARLSKGAGTPGGIPDILGLAFRVYSGPGQPWDITLASSGSGAVGRMVLLPSGGWSGTTFSSLLPYRAGGQWFWMIAEADENQPSGTTDPAAAARQADTTTLRFRLYTAAPGLRKRTVGDLVLRESHGDAQEPSFDPMLNVPQGIHLSPSWVGKVRELTYIGSRSGRKAD